MNDVPPMNASAGISIFIKPSTVFSISHNARIIGITRNADIIVCVKDLFKLAAIIVSASM